MSQLEAVGDSSARRPNLLGQESVRRVAPIMHLNRTSSYVCSCFRNQVALFPIQHARSQAIDLCDDSASVGDADDCSITNSATPIGRIQRAPLRELAWTTSLEESSGANALLTQRKKLRWCLIWTSECCFTLA